MTVGRKQEVTPAFRAEKQVDVVPVRKKFSIANLLWFTAAVAIFIQLSLLATPVVLFLVPIAVFLIVLRPKLGRFDLSTYEICGAPGIWATGVNAIATPIAVLISTLAPPLPSDDYSPYRDHPIEFPLWLILIVLVAYGFVGAIIGSFCSLIMTVITAWIRSIAKQGGTPREI